MPFEQEHLANPFGMDETCTACPALVDTRSRIVHGYGDVAAEFIFVAEQPTAAADATGMPVDDTDRVREVLLSLDFLQPDRTDADGNPLLENAFLTHLTRCRHPDRAPTDDEIGNCDAFLSAELRMINPEIIVPIGDRPLTVLGEEHTTEDPAELSAETLHATPLRGRGFELVPLAGRENLTDEQVEAFVTKMRELMAGDYRQTKGRQGR